MTAAKKVSKPMDDHERTKRGRDDADQFSELGQRLKQLRLSRHLTIESLGQSSGLSKAYLSQLETGKATPSIQTVRKLCDFFGVKSSYLLDDDNHAAAVLRADDQPVLQFGTTETPPEQRKHIRFLSAMGRDLELVILQIPAGYAAGGDDGHEGEEVFYVLYGEVTADVAGQTHTLVAGDSLHIDSRSRHALRNETGRPASLIVARTPPGFIDLRFDRTLVKEGRQE